MKLEGKKALIARTLGVGKGRIGLNNERIAEVKEAITKQDVRDLFASGAIFLHPLKGRTTRTQRNNRRRAGKTKNPVPDRKRVYMIITRKLRGYVGELKKQKQVTLEQSKLLRREIRARKFKSKAHMKERIALFERQ